jgi:MFS family permease
LLLALLVPVGVGGGMTVSPITSALLDAVDPTSAGLASGVLNAGRQVGGAIGYALFGALLAGAAGFIAGMHLSLAIGVTCLAGTITASALLPCSPTRRRQEVVNSTTTHPPAADRDHVSVRARNGCSGSVLVASPVRPGQVSGGGDGAEGGPVEHPCDRCRSTRSSRPVPGMGAFGRGEDRE